MNVTHVMSEICGEIGMSGARNDEMSDYVQERWSYERLVTEMLLVNV